MNRWYGYLYVCIYIYLDMYIWERTPPSPRRTHRMRENCGGGRGTRSKNGLRVCARGRGRVREGWGSSVGVRETLQSPDCRSLIQALPPLPFSRLLAWIHTEYAYTCTLVLFVELFSLLVIFIYLNITKFSYAFIYIDIQLVFNLVRVFLHISLCYGYAHPCMKMKYLITYNDNAFSSHPGKLVWVSSGV